MSIKTLRPIGPAGPDPEGGDKLLIFLVLSLIIHAGVLGGFLTLVPEMPERKDVSPIVVDIVRPRTAVIDRGVVALPPARLPDAGVKKSPSFYADRDQSVEKETVPGAVPSERLDPTVGSPGTQAARPAPSPSPSGESESEKSERAAKAGKQAPATKESPSLRPAPPRADSEADIMVAPPAPASTPAGGVEGTAGEAAARPSRATRAVHADPNLFPSDERLAQLSREYARSTPRGERGKTLRLNTSELKYQSYILNMKRKIELRWRYPEMAVANGWQGILSIDFSINRDGSLGDVVVKKSSGYPVLDDAAVTALRLAGPYPPFPEDFFVERINIKAQFEYLIRLRPGR